jgi:hypothetical protein
MNFKVVHALRARMQEYLMFLCHACRLSVEVVVGGFCGFCCTTTSPVLPSDIVTHEQVAKALAGAMKTASGPGLNKLEIIRIHAF